MTPRQLLDLAAADGVVLALTPSGRLKLSGDQVDVDRWIPVIRQYADAIVAELRAERQTTGTSP
jgi:hypothetical protein